MAKKKDQVQGQLTHPLPQPMYSQPFQGGITDPIWSDSNAEAAAFGKDFEEDYRADYAGRIDRQEVQSILRADLLTADRNELREVLKLLTKFVVDQVTMKPSIGHLRILEPIPESYRVTITVGFGASLFVDRSGFDRFGLRSAKPKFLKTMPHFEGDQASFDPRATASDLVFVISSDEPYVNVAIVRYFTEFFNKEFLKQHPDPQDRPVLRFTDVQQGFARKDKREFLKFDDGIENLQIDPTDLRRLVYVDGADNEPNWCLNGSYLVYRKIRERMPAWESMNDQAQELIIGRKKDSGKPLSVRKTGHQGMTPVFASPLDSRDGPFNAHIRKVQPRRPDPDLFGLNDLERRFLRRPYPFFDPINESGECVNGLHFVAFMKSIQRQFEHIVNMWQMNPDFPIANTGPDALYANGILSTIDGGYYFCPPGLRNDKDYFGSGMFAD
jgi:deferrochelatase/peroxidase EfeB